MTQTTPRPILVALVVVLAQRCCSVHLHGSFISLSLSLSVSLLPRLHLQWSCERANAIAPGDQLGIGMRSANTVPSLFMLVAITIPPTHAPPPPVPQCISCSIFVLHFHLFPELLFFSCCRGPERGRRQAANRNRFDLLLKELDQQQL